MRNSAVSERKLSIWDCLNEIKVGPLQLPWFALLSVVIVIAVYTETVPVDMLGGFGVIITLGWLLGKIGNVIPGLNKFGGSTILSMLVPAFLVLYGLLPDNSIEAVTMLMSEANFLDLYVFSLVTGSILGMNRQVLVQGFARMMIPMFVGMVLAMLIPAVIGQLIGLGFEDTLFNIVTPSLAGGIGGGVLPLALGYSQIQGVEYGEMVATLAPASILSNFFSIAGAAIVSSLGDKQPALTGNGVLVKQGKDMDFSATKDKPQAISYQTIGIGLFLLVAVYICEQMI